MGEMPLVSMVTPSYNQGIFLEQTIRSVLEQDYPNIEYLVIDGGSTDESVAIIQRHASQIAYWESQPDRGQAHAINKGLQRARGEILGWLNSDDVLFPGTVSRVVEQFSRHPDVGVVYGHLERIDATGRLVPTPILPKDRVEFGPAYVIGECVVNQPGSFWRRSIMDEVGLLDEHLAYALDYEYWIRMALTGVRFKRLPETVALFRLSAGSKTVGQTAAMAEEQLRVLDEVLAAPGLAQRLGMSQTQIDRLARRTRAQIGLRIVYGSLKSRRWDQARRWLGRVLQDDPLVIFERRWLDLAIARVRRNRYR